MTDIRHHLTDQILMAYSTGALPEAFSLVVATHVSLCDDCRAELAACEALGGEVLDGCEEAPLADNSLEMTLALIANDDARVAAPQPAPSDAVFPAPLRDYVGGDLDAVKWRSVGGGASQAILKTSKDASVRLLKIPGGVAMPDHSHGGMELTLVLQGAFSDAEERFGPGDVEVADEDVNHTPVAELGPDCICLTATDAPLQFKGVLPRIAQPFLRI
jgi:putative transcriptional regulator